MKNFLISVCVIAIAISSVPAFSADSLIYQTNATWQTIIQNEDAGPFALEGNRLWYSTPSGIVSMDMKTREKSKFTQLGTLATTEVNDMVMDAASVLWVATSSGLAMRSGAAVTIFTTTNGLPDNDVRKIAVGDDRRIWIATANGVAVYKAGAWTTYTDKAGLLSNDVRWVAIDSKNRAWFATKRGISCFDGSAWSSHTMDNGLSWNDAHVVACDARNGYIWAAVGERDINTYNGSTWNTYIDVSASITDIMIDTQSRIWVAALGGLVKYNSEEWITDPAKLGLTVSEPRRFLRDGFGNLWFGSTKGIIRLANPYPY